MADDRRSKSHLTPPPPQKRIKSVDLYRAQHGISPDLEPLKSVEPLLVAAAAYRGRERNRSKENVNRSRDSSSQDLSKSELRDSLLGQALEASSASSVLSIFSIIFFFKSSRKRNSNNPKSFFNFLLFCYRRSIQIWHHYKHKVPAKIPTAAITRQHQTQSIMMTL